MAQEQRAETAADYGALSNLNPEIFDAEAISVILPEFPGYVQTAAVADARGEDPSYLKVIGDKWGSRNTATGKHVELPPMIFYRAALKAAERIAPSTNDLEATTEMLFNKMQAREMFPNTPYMANACHSDLAEQFLPNLKTAADEGNAKAAEMYQTVAGWSKRKEQLFACFVLPVSDSRKGIFGTMADASEIQAHTGGTGFSFTKLRQANEPISKSGGNSDGPVAFMDAYSKVLGDTINQGGKRDGANMFMLAPEHPDIMRFIYSKAVDGALGGANLSVFMPDWFMEKATSESEEGQFYAIKNPHHHESRPEVSENTTATQIKRYAALGAGSKKVKLSLELSEDEKTVLSPHTPIDLDDQYKEIGRVNAEGEIELNARKVLRHLSYSAWANGEPGIIFDDAVNRENPTHPRNLAELALQVSEKPSEFDAREFKPVFDLIGAAETTGRSIEELIMETDEDGVELYWPEGIGRMVATNPCGEKPLLPYESCVLGHVNLSKVVKKTDKGSEIDWELLDENTRLMYHILDGAIDQNDYTLEAIESMQQLNRKIGLGFTGLADLLIQMEVPYNSEEARTLAGDIMQRMQNVSLEESEKQAEKEGAYPNFKFSMHRDNAPRRNAILTTLAPTGTTGTACKVRGYGCEPEYALSFFRTTAQGTQMLLLNPYLEEKLGKYPIFTDAIKGKEGLLEFLGDTAQGNGSIQSFELSQEEGESDGSFERRNANLDTLKEILRVSGDVSPRDHILMQAGLQESVEDAISKTINFNSGVTVEDVEAAYVLAWESKVKGTTFYRDGTRKGQPISVSLDVEDEAGRLEGLVSQLDALPKEEKLEAMAKLVHWRLEEDKAGHVMGPQERIKTPWGVLFANAGDEYIPGNGAVPYQCFFTLGKSGGDVSAMTEGFGRLVSSLLKIGVPYEYIIDQLEGIGGATQEGFGQNRVASLPDGIAKVLGQTLKVKEELKDGLSGKEGSKKAKAAAKKKAKKANGNICPVPGCGKPLRMTEGCEKCDCGYSRC
jgi:ribonucleotide reductase alpha subunit